MGHPVTGGYKYGNLVLQIGRVSDEAVKCGFGPLSDCTANCRPVLSSERAPHGNKTATPQQGVISGRKSHNGARHQYILTD
jgi:hypothetical protein